MVIYLMVKGRVMQVPKMIASQHLMILFKLFILKPDQISIKPTALANVEKDTGLTP